MKKTVVLNHKMNFSEDEAKEAKNIMDEYAFDNINLIVCPTYLNINIFSNGYNIGAQNCHYEEKGQFTGEISPYHLKYSGVSNVILGHSDRRDFETTEIIAKKIKSVLNIAMTPIVCIGETKMERDLNKTSEVLKKKLTLFLTDLNDNEIDEIIIAYEPIWAIGSGTTPTINEIKEVSKYIRNIISTLSGSTNYKVIYGGSINKDNYNKIINIDNIDGVLIGSFCLDTKILCETITKTV